MVLFLLLLLAALVFGFGAVRLLLMRTTWEAYTVEAAVLAAGRTPARPARRR